MTTEAASDPHWRQYRDRPRMSGGPLTGAQSDAWAPYIDSWEWFLLAADRAESTRTSHLGIVRQFASATDSDPLTVTPQDVTAYLVRLRQRCKPSTVALAYVVVRQFFAWLVTEGEREDNPTDGVPVPRAAPTPVPLLGGDDMALLMATASGRTFVDRRDAAMLRCLADCGIRIGELCGMDVADVDLREREVNVVGKGRRPRVVPFGPRTGQALDRYLRVRPSHPLAHVPALWLGQRGPIQRSGVDRMLKRRAARAGIEPIHAHQFRHTFADAYLSAGGGEGNLMRLCGWRTRSMLDRYGAVRATERAHEEYRTLNIGGRW